MADYKEAFMMGVMQDFQKYRNAATENFVLAQQRMTGGLENLTIRGQRPLVELDVAEGLGLSTATTRIDPTSQSWHSGNSQIQAAIAENNALIRAKMKEM